MKIRTKNGFSIDVYAVYWHDSKTLFLGMSAVSKGLTSYDLDDVEVIDSQLGSDYLFYRNRLNGIYHRVLIEYHLLDDLLENDEAAYVRFMELIESPKEK